MLELLAFLAIKAIVGTAVRAIVIETTGSSTAGTVVGTVVGVLVGGIPDVPTPTFPDDSA